MVATSVAEGLGADVVVDADGVVDGGDCIADDEDLSVGLAALEVLRIIIAKVGVVFCCHAVI